MNWIIANSLWIVGLGLMLASSGIDGAYMARWMPTGWGWLGFVLNTTADIAGMVLMYFFGRLQQDKAKAKRRLSFFILAAEIVAVVYSWFFGWRQLLTVLPAIEPLAYRWVAPVAAGFIPALLAFIGYAESLLAGRFDDTQGTQHKAEVAPKVALLDNVKPETPTVKPVVDSVKAEATAQLDALAMQVYDLYTADPQPTKTAIAEALQVSRPTVNARLEVLQAAGMLGVNPGNGKHKAQVIA